jgi:hypothetical protein
MLSRRGASCDCKIVLGVEPIGRSGRRSLTGRADDDARGVWLFKVDDDLRIVVIAIQAENQGVVGGRKVAGASFHRNPSAVSDVSSRSERTACDKDCHGRAEWRQGVGRESSSEATAPELRLITQTDYFVLPDEPLLDGVLLPELDGGVMSGVPGLDRRPGVEGLLLLPLDVPLELLLPGDPVAVELGCTPKCE